VGLLVAAALMLVSCASADHPVRAKRQKTVELPATYQKVFYFPYDQVWRAAQLAVKYPIAINNMDNGTLQTEEIKGPDGFISPQVEQKPSSGLKYQIVLSMTKGKTNGNNSVRVIVRKDVEKQRDFFSEAEAIPSDGLEEKTILYRIERELLIDDALKKEHRSQGN